MATLYSRFLLTALAGLTLSAAPVFAQHVAPSAAVPAAEAAATTILNADFNTGDAGFTTDNNTVWKLQSGKGWRAFGRIGTANRAIDAFLTSPVIDLTGYADATLTFTHYAWMADNDQPADVLSVEVADPSVPDGQVEDNPVKLNDAIQWPTGQSSTEEVNSGAVSLKAYTGKQIKLRFHYTGTTVENLIWLIKNVTVTGTPLSAGIEGVTAGSGLDLTKPFSVYTVDGRQADATAKGLLIYKQGTKVWKVVK